jgi:hypothetical protein
VTTGFDLKNAEPVFIVVERDALDKASQDLGGVFVLYACTTARDCTVLPMLESLRGAKIRHGKHRVDQLVLSRIAYIARALDPDPHASMT